MSFSAIHDEPGVHEDLHPHICGANMRRQNPIYCKWASEGFFPGGDTKGFFQNFSRGAKRG